MRGRRESFQTRFGARRKGAFVVPDPLWWEVPAVRGAMLVLVSNVIARVGFAVLRIVYSQLFGSPNIPNEVVALIDPRMTNGAMFDPFSMAAALGSLKAIIELVRNANDAQLAMKISGEVANIQGMLIDAQQQNAVAAEREPGTPR